MVEPADEDDAGGSTWCFDPATDITGVGQGWPSAWGGRTMEWADWRAGYESQPDEHCYWVDDVDVTGTIPAALEGTYFRNGPALFEFGGQRLRHPFDGDGLMSALSVSSGRAHFRSRYVRTAERAAEQAAGKLLYPCTFGTSLRCRSSCMGRNQHRGGKKFRGQLWAMQHQRTGLHQLQLDHQHPQQQPLHQKNAGGFSERARAMSWCRHAA